jgi:copper(I)-binding protein
MILERRLRRVAVMLAVAGIAALAAPGHDIFASEFKVGAITIETPWSRATPGGAHRLGRRLDLRAVARHSALSTSPSVSAIHAEVSATKALIHHCSND